MQANKGFTLLELLTVVIILSIILLIAAPVYFSYVQHIRRYDAIATLESIYLKEEKYRLANETYAPLSEIWDSNKTDHGYYELSLSNLSNNSFTLTASAIDTQQNDTENKTDCSILTLKVENQLITRTPQTCWKR